MSSKKKEELVVQPEKKKKAGKWKAVLAVVLVCAAALIFLIFRPEEKIEEAEFSAVEEICELATLKCYYHNVAEYEKQPDGLFKYGLFKYGYKKLWIEYDGIIEVGIDASEVTVSRPDENGVVSIYVPEAKILSVDADEDSMSDPIVDTGILTKITTEEKTEAFAAAQATMEENAKADSSILGKAHRNAQKLLEQYVIGVGEQIGQQYEVRWTDKP